MAKNTVPRGQSTTPPAQPSVTPNFNQSTHDFTLQVVVQMQKDLGELRGEMNAKVDRLITDVAALDGRVTKISHRIAWIAGGAATVGALIGAALAVLNIVPWDRIFPKPPPPAVAASAPPPPPAAANIP